MKIDLQLRDYLVMDMELGLDEGSPHTWSKSLLPEKGISPKQLIEMIARQSRELGGRAEL